MSADVFTCSVFLLLLGPLVFVHEFGHFSFRQSLFQTSRVDVFSMGFGPKFFAKEKWGRDRVRALGGAARGDTSSLYGQDPNRARRQATCAAPGRCGISTRGSGFLIFFRRPASSISYSRFFVFAVMLIIGEPPCGADHRAGRAGQPGLCRRAFAREDIVTADRPSGLSRSSREVAKAITDAPRQEARFPGSSGAGGQLKEGHGLAAGSPPGP